MQPSLGYEKSTLALRTLLWQHQAMHLSRLSPILILIPGILSRQVPPNLRTFYNNVKSGRCSSSNLLQGGFQDEEDGPKGTHESVHQCPLHFTCLASYLSRSTCPNEPTPPLSHRLLILPPPPRLRQRLRNLHLLPLGPRKHGHRLRRRPLLPR